MYVAIFVEYLLPIKFTELNKGKLSMLLLLPVTANELLNIIVESMNVVNWLNMTMEFHFYYNRKSHTKYVNITSDNCKN